MDTELMKYCYVAELCHH